MKNSDYQKLTTLLSAWSDRRMSEDQRTELDILLQSSEEAREIYLEFVSMDVGLQENLRQVPKHLLEGRFDLPVDDSEFDDNQPKDRGIRPGGEDPSKQGRSIHFGFFFGALTATIAFLFLFLRVPDNEELTDTGSKVTAEVVEDNPTVELPLPTFGFSNQATTPSVALMESTLNAVWADVAPREGEALYKGILELVEGLASIDFYSGARAILQGPAEIEILSQSHIRCLSGKIRVHVPEPAQGFIVETPDGRVVDLGTEFTLNVQDKSGTEVHVVEGEVDVQASPNSTPKGTPPTLLTQGQTARMSKESSPKIVSNEPIDIVNHRELSDILRNRDAEVVQRWREFSESWKADPNLILYYDFEPSARGDRVLVNRALQASENRATDGVIVGAEWSEGRFPGKTALEFRKISDQVRLVIPGSYDSITMSVWLRCDFLERQYTSILLTDQWSEGEPHWQFFHSGFNETTGARLVTNEPIEDMVQFSVRAPTPNVRYRSKLSSPDIIGHWTHLAVTYNSSTSEVAQYINGELLNMHRTFIDRDYQTTTVPIRFGNTQIANWYPTTGDICVCRSFHGKMDEFLLVSRALSASEIAEMYNSSKP